MHAQLYLFAHGIQVKIHVVSINGDGEMDMMVFLSDMVIGIGLKQDFQ